MGTRPPLLGTGLGQWGPVCSVSSLWGYSSSCTWTPREAGREQGLPQAAGAGPGQPQDGLPDGGRWGGGACSCTPGSGGPYFFYTINVLHHLPSVWVPFCLAWGALPLTSSIESGGVNLTLHAGQQEKKTLLRCVSPQTMGPGPKQV